MAELRPPKLTWPAEDEDPGLRTVELPAPLPSIGDDFDWQQRDFESFRGAMMRELRERFPERRRWTAGDVEAVLVDLLASVLDQLSDMADRVSAEAYLESARRVESVIGWLHFLGYDPAKERELTKDALLALYAQSPSELALDRGRGPASIRRQRRMVSLADYGVRIEEHPLVDRAYSQVRWGGSWFEVLVTVSPVNGWRLGDTLTLQEASGPRDRVVHAELKDEIEKFHTRNDLREPQWERTPTLRVLLADHLSAFRMVGHVVELIDIVPVGLVIELCVSLREAYFRSEVRREVERVLGVGPTGFFRPGRLAAGQDVQLGDIYGAVMPLDGVRDIKVRQFRKLGDPPGGEVSPTIELADNELAVCGNGCGEVILALRGGRLG